MNDFNFSKMRCKKLAYMLEDGIWNWFITFTDHMGQLLPKHAVALGRPLTMKTQMNYGAASQSQIPNGPNK